MTRFYLLANIIGNGGSYSPREFTPFGIFDEISKANDFRLTLENFHELSIIILDSQEFDRNNFNRNSEDLQYQIQRVFHDIIVPEILEDQLLYFVTSTSHVDMGELRSFFPQFSLNLHGVFSNSFDAQKCIDNLGITNLKLGEHSSLPVITSTLFNPVFGEQIALLAQHYDINYLSNNIGKPYMLTVKIEHLDQIRTSVLESIYPYNAYTNIDPSTPDIDQYAKQLFENKRVEVLHKAASLVFTARNWDKKELKSYLEAKYNESDNLIYFHLIDYPDKKTLFDNNRMYSKQQIICNYINDQEKTQKRLDLQSQETILQMLVDLSPAWS